MTSSSSALSSVARQTQKAARYKVSSAVNAVIEKDQKARALYEATVDELKELCDRYMYRLKAGADYIIESTKANPIALFYSFSGIEEARNDMKREMESVHGISVADALKLDFLSDEHKNALKLNRPGETLVTCIEITEPHPFGVSFDHAAHNVTSDAVASYTQVAMFKLGISKTVPQPKRLRANMLQTGTEGKITSEQL